MDITIRTATAADAVRLERFLFRLDEATLAVIDGLQHDALTPEVLELLIRSDPDKSWTVVVTSADAIVGFAHARRGRDDPALAETVVVVEPHWRGFGLGTCLLDCLVDSAAPHGVRSLVGRVDPRLAAPAHLLEALGLRSIADSRDPATMTVDLGARATLTPA